MPYQVSHSLQIPFNRFWNIVCRCIRYNRAEVHSCISTTMLRKLNSLVTFVLWQFDILTLMSLLPVVSDEIAFLLVLPWHQEILESRC